MKKIILSLALVALSFSTGVFAKLPSPAKCPTVADIRQIGIMSLLKDDDNGRTYYAALAMHRYNTPQRWGFFLAPIYVNSEAEARSEADAALKTLSGIPTPVYLVDRDQEYYICLYNTEKGYVAQAVTPLPVGEHHSLGLIKH